MNNFWDEINYKIAFSIANLYTAKNIYLMIIYWLAVLIKDCQNKRVDFAVSRENKNKHNSKLKC